MGDESERFCWLCVLVAARSGTRNKFTRSTTVSASVWSVGGAGDPDEIKDIKIQWHNYKIDVRRSRSGDKWKKMAVLTGCHSRSGVAAYLFGSKVMIRISMKNWKYGTCKNSIRWMKASLLGSMGLRMTVKGFILYLSESHCLTTHIQPKMKMSRLMQV